MAAFRTGDTLVWIIGPVQDANGAAVTGATWSAVVATKPDGTTFAPTYTEIGNGVYKATFVSTARGNWFLYSQATVSGVVYADAGSITVDDGYALASDWTSARAAKLDSLGAASVTVQSPIVNQVATVYQGDDYKTQRPLTWAFTNVPSLTGATVTLVMVSDNLTTTVVCAVANPGTALQTVTAQLTRTQTNALERSPVATNYDLSATLASNEVTTLARGPVKVVRDVP